MDNRDSAWGQFFYSMMFITGLLFSCALYLDGLGLKEGYLVIFDPGDIDWEEKIYWKEEVYKGKTIFMVGL